MARKTRTRTALPPRFKPQPRDLLLAGVGAVSLGRKQFLQAYADGFQGLAALRDRAQDAVLAVATRLDGQVDELRRQAERWRRKAQGYGAQVEHRFGPVLTQLGVPVQKPRAKRKPAKPVARRRKSA